MYNRKLSDIWKRGEEVRDLDKIQFASVKRNECSSLIFQETFHESNAHKPVSV